jgi:hypothetical protein
MDCLEFRRICGADPYSRYAACQEHAAGCEACARYLTRMRELDALIFRALSVDPPTGTVDRNSVRPSARSASATVRRRWTGLAASFVLAAGAAAAFWLGVERPPEALSAEVVAHILHEPAALAPGRVALESNAVRHLLANHNLRLTADVGPVLYARTCVFRGRLIPHLVVETDSGPVTVLVLPEEPVREPMTISTGRFSGRVVPFGSGSMAIVGEQDPSQAEDRLIEAVGWDV